LVILVRSMRKIHANYKIALFFKNKPMINASGDYIPIFTPARRSSASFSTVLTLGPEHDE